LVPLWPSPKLRAASEQPPPLHLHLASPKPKALLRPAHLGDSVLPEADRSSITFRDSFRSRAFLCLHPPPPLYPSIVTYFKPTNIPESSGARLSRSCQATHPPSGRPPRPSTRNTDPTVGCDITCSLPLTTTHRTTRIAPNHQPPSRRQDVEGHSERQKCDQGLLQCPDQSARR
jgi:hypothetical protein